MRRTVLATVSTVVGLIALLSFKSHGARPNRLADRGTGGQATAAAPAAPQPATGLSSGPAPSQAQARRTVDGQAMDTPYGPVQLRVTFVGRRITDITPLQLPSGRSRDEEINSYAVPVLTQEALQAQSARIDSVSGATYTSEGYAQSLQSALDQAHA